MKLLLVEDNPGDVRLLRIYLQEAGVDALQYELVHFSRLEDALSFLATEEVAIILLDLSLPDTQGSDTMRRMAEATMRDIPIIVLTGTDDKMVAVNALQLGAQDYLVKGQIDGNILLRSMRYALERHRMQTALRSLSLQDELTGLYNRRGFFTLAEHHIKVAVRTKKPFSLVYLDIDDMKAINDTYGHRAGDEAVIETAGVLHKTFRDSDIIARIGGDEFVVIALEGTYEANDQLSQRIQEAINAHNAANPPGRFQLSVSVGVIEFNPREDSTIQSLLDQADALMYETKRGKKAAH